MTLSCLSPRQSYGIGNVVAPLTQRKGAEVQSCYTERGEMAALRLLWISPRSLSWNKFSACLLFTHESESDSRSVVSNSTTPWNNNNVSLLFLGISQARILEWVAIPFSRGSSQARDWTQVSCIAGGFFTSWATKGSPRILEWVTYPFSSWSSWPRNRTRLSCTAGGFFTSWGTREAE